MEEKINLINAFVENGQGGNPAGVVLHADNMSEADMQALATRLGLSETAFVSRSKIATVKLDFFTPNKRIPHCGHATVGAFSIMAQMGLLNDGSYTKETVDGIRHIRLHGNKAYLEQREVAASTLPARHYPALADALGVSAQTLNQIVSPALVNNGVGWLVVMLPSRAQLKALKPSLPAIQAISDELAVIGIYVISAETQTPGRHLSARMFAPSYGIDEEAATGMGAGCAAIFLHHYLKLPGNTLLIEQGQLMNPPSPSLLEVELELKDGSIERLWVGGAAQITEK